MMLRLGIVGTTLIFVMLALIVYGGWRAYREQRIDRDLFMFLVAALTLHLLVCFTDFRMLHTDWRYYWFLVGGALYSFSLLHPIVRVQRTIPPPHDGAKSETGNN
jgi:O-antigen ligase